MKKTLRMSVLPLFLVLCVAVGGSSQQTWSNLVLQLFALVVAAWAVASRRSNDLTPASRLLLALLGIGIVFVIAQMVPLPPSLWSALPGRELLVEGFAALGMDLPWMPLSLAPYDTLAALLALLPAVAVLVTGLRIAQRERWLVTALLVSVLFAVLLGALQAPSGQPSDSPWYLYRITNDGAVGFFANRNHMGSLLLVSIPFGIALMASAASLSSERARMTGLLIFGAATLLTVLGGVVLNRSLAALALALPVLLLSALLLPAGWRLRRLALPAGAIAMVACLVLLTSSPVAGELAGSDRSSFESRTQMWGQTMQLAVQTFPFGTGLGSFVSVYPLLEDPAATGRTYINHAHNDYLELLLEMGLIGILLVLAFLVWWGRQAVLVWQSTLSTQYARAATIASGTLLVHSLVDYPLRTGALSAIFALCLALMAQPGRQRHRSDRTDARPTKHVKIG